MTSSGTGPGTLGVSLLLEDKVEFSCRLPLVEDQRQFEVYREPQGRCSCNGEIMVRECAQFELRSIKEHWHSGDPFEVIATLLVMRPERASPSQVVSIDSLYIGNSRVDACPST
jgi:hypothetical protein